MKRRGAFTLIELLVVIAIIAILVSILIPALAGARDASRMVVCRINVKSILMSMILYAEDYEVIPGTHWQGEDDLDWGGRNNLTYITNPEEYRHPIETSVLYEYIDGADEVLGCPTAKREANTFYDYTMVIRMAGARPDLAWQAVWRTRPRAGRRSPVEYFPGIPLMIEEDENFFNRPYDGGSWAWRDQFTHRHQDEANLGYLDGSVGTFNAPAGPDPLVEEEEDFDARDLKVLFRGRQYDMYDGAGTPFGWVNSPRNVP